MNTTVAVAIIVSRPSFFPHEKKLAARNARVPRWKSNSRYSAHRVRNQRKLSPQEVVAARRKLAAAINPNLADSDTWEDRDGSV